MRKDPGGILKSGFMIFIRTWMVSLYVKKGGVFCRCRMSDDGVTGTELKPGHRVRNAGRSSFRPGVPKTARCRQHRSGAGVFHGREGMDLAGTSDINGIFFDHGIEMRA